MSAKRLRTGDEELPDTVVADLNDATESPRPGRRLAINDVSLTIRKRIEVRALHSSGGIGEVWVARDELLHRDVALKRLKAEQAEKPDLRARFYREARLTSQLDHPGVVPVYDYSESEDGTQSFYTMRFVRGKTLRELTLEFHRRRLEDNADLVGGAFLRLLGYFASVCDTIAYAHSRRVIHRDLKGDNVIVGDFGEVVVLDWGLAKSLDEREPEPEPEPELGGRRNAPASSSGAETMHGQALGTPAYMAPEQARGELGTIDERADVYGLAALLYELLTGRPPFLSENVDELLETVIDTPPARPSELVPGVPAELETVCLRGLAKDPSARPASASVLRDSVSGWLNALAERRREVEERERFFSLSTDLLAIIDPHGRVTQSNPAWSAICGDPQRRVDGERLVSLVLAEDRAEAEQALSRARAGEDASFDARVATASRGARWVNWRVRTLPNTAELYLVGRDITELKRSERRFRGLLESAPDATCVVDVDGVIELVNRRLEQLFGYQREELIGQRIETLVPAPLRERHQRHFAAYVASPRVRPMGGGQRLLGQRKDGSIFALEISLGPVPTDERLMVACSIRATADA